MWEYYFYPLLVLDFHKIGGYEIFNPCFNSVHAQIRSNACNILAEISQNNPYCQDRALECGYVKPLLELVDTDVDQAVTIKAVYALSCNNHLLIYMPIFDQNFPYAKSVISRHWVASQSDNVI